MSVVGLGCGKPVRQTGGHNFQRISVTAPNVAPSAPTIHGLF
jgi:hypothetical protein